MQIKLVDMNNVNKGKVDLPIQFAEEIRPDLIKRAVLGVQSNKRQPYGAFPEAGKRPSAKLSRRRRDYKTSYGHGISRVPRKIMTKRGIRFFWVAAYAPGTVGGRRSHPPKAEHDFTQKVNKRENRKAIRSALAASMVKELVTKRGHHVPESYPFIIEDKAESLSKTKDVEKFLNTMGLTAELERTSQWKVRAGKGKKRGRRYKKKKGPLLVVGNDCPLLKAAANIPGVDVVKVTNVNAELLAPGADIARLTIFTKSAIDRLDKEKLFTEEQIHREDAKPKVEVKKQK